MKRKLVLLATTVCLFLIVPSANGQSDLRKALGIINQLQGRQGSSGGSSQPSSQPPRPGTFNSPSIPSESGGRNTPDQRFERGGDLMLGGPPFGGGRIVQPGSGNGQQTIIDSRPRDQFGRLIQQPSGQQQIQVGESYYYDEFGRRIVIRSQGQTVTQPRQTTTQSVNQNRSGSVSQIGSDIPSTPVDMARNPYIIIRCPGTTVGSLTYTLESSKGSYQFQISAGQEQRFRQSTAWTISFFNGSTTLKYSLVAGKTYVITKGDGNQWQVTGAPHYGS